MTSRGRVNGERVGAAGQPARPSWALAMAFAAVLLMAAGCTVSGQAAAIPVSARPGAIDATISLSSLEAAPEPGCALPMVPQAVRAAGLMPAAGPTGSTNALNPSVRITGVAAQCDVELSGGGSLEILLVASGQSSAVAVTMPLLARAAAMSADQIRLLVEATLKLPAGQFVDIPGSAPATVYIVAVSGAASAALLVAGTGGPTRTQTTAVAKALAGG